MTTFGSDNLFPRVRVAHDIAAADPPAGQTQLRADSSGRLFQITPAGVITYLDSPAGFTNPMTTQDDVIVGGTSGAPGRLAKGSDGQVLTVSPSTHHLVWATPSSGFSDPMTTRGDVIVRNASNATARLGRGSAGTVLTSDGTDVGWAAAGGGGISSGTSNPGSPTDGQLFYRSDLDMLIRYRSSGTRWVCTCPHFATIADQRAVLPLGSTNYNEGVYPHPSANLWIETFVVSATVTGTNDGGTYWTWSEGSAGGNINSSTWGTAPAWGMHTQAINAAISIAGTAGRFELAVTKTNNPGATYFSAGYTYRIIVT
jgi:hypothetical protein